MKRVLVSGGAGFLGSHLCDALVRQGHDVICVDNYFSGSKANIAHLMGLPNFEAMRHDVTFPLFVEVDEIYNLACPASPRHYQFDPVQTTKTCVSGAINMLGLAKRTGARIIQASTSEIYGEPLEHPQSERYLGNVDVRGPRACYDEGKRCAETLFYDYRRQHNVDIRVARLFNSYGPRMQVGDGRVVSNFVTQAIHNRPITIYGDGSQTRSFCYADDTIAGLMAIMATEPDDEVTFNLGNPEEITIRTLAEIICELTGAELRIEHCPIPENDPTRRCPNIDRLTEVTNWRPTVSLRGGLQRTIEYFEKGRSAEITPLTAMRSGV